MPSVLRYASTFKTKPKAFLSGLIDTGYCIQNVEYPWAIQKTNVQIRRNLFELHAGHEARQFPTNIHLETSQRPSHDDHWFSSSDELIAALGPLGQDYARPKKYHWLLDLSFVDPMLVALDRERAIKEAADFQERKRLVKEAGAHLKQRVHILIEYLQHVHPILQHRNQISGVAMPSPQLDRGLRKVFDYRTQEWLKAKGFDATDVMNWAWILTANTSERAAMRLTVLANEFFQNRRRANTVPQFIFTFLLRRKSMSARALKPLLVHAWRLLEDSETFVPTSPKEPLPNSFSKSFAEGPRVLIEATGNGMKGNVFLVIIIRLLRRARVVWPAACENVVALLTRYLDGINFRKDTLSKTMLQPEDISQLTYIYNTILRLLSLPSSLHPFQSAVFQQRAQFSVLRRMNQFDPPLAVDKRGYQAIVRMQLMHKKTLKEREWANMKARSWPPWKEEKLGIDASIGVDHGISRAKEVLRGAEEAGYSTNTWDDAAGILSGWDTDGSPTIQTRSIVKYPSNEPKQTKESRQDAVWARRIEATRTLDEAWSCFLSWKDQTTSATSGQQPYLAMFKKIVHNPQARSQKTEKPADNLRSEQLLPGDALEVQPAPESPREAVYVRRPPPDVNGFLGMMKDDEIKPSGRLLTLLLVKAPSFEAGLQCLKASALQPAQITALLEVNRAKTSELQSALEFIPMYLFAGFIDFLANFAPTVSDRRATNKSERDPAPEHDRLTDAFGLENVNSLWQAYQLLLRRKPKYRPAYYNLFHALVRPNVVLSSNVTRGNQDSQDVRTWKMVVDLLDQMRAIDLPIDLDGFNVLCIGLEKALFASERQRWKRSGHHTQTETDEGGRDGSGTNSPYPQWQHSVLDQSLPLMKEIFKNAVRSPDMQQPIPDHLSAAKTEIDRTMQNKQDKAIEDDDDDDVDDVESSLEAENSPAQQERAFLPPACLLPKLLEVPHPAHLHAFIRILGLRRDYAGILDLVEWMSLFADEINALIAESMNGKRMMRRCMVAVRVFLERSWMCVERDDGCDRAGREGVVIEAEPASREVVRAVRDVVAANKRWGGWPGEEEVREYVNRGRFL